MNAPLNGVPSTLTEALAKLDEYYAKKPTPEEWSQIWPPILFNAKLPPTHEDLVIDRLVALNIGKIRTLKTELKQFREEQEQQRQIAEGGLAGARADKYTTLVRILREDRTLLAQPPRFNQMTQTVELVRSSGSSTDLADVHVSKLREDLGKLGTGFSFGKDDVFDALTQVAHERAYHPVREYLTSLTWDGIPRLDAVAKEYLGAKQELAPVLVRKWFISAVARALQPGCKVDTALILTGGQGVKKSTFFKTLGGDWYCDTSLDLSDKDSYAALRGAWIYEWPELETMQRARSQNTVKAFMSSQEDKYRPPYGRTPVKVPRSCVIVGTTNDEQFLTDPTGNRRYWPVEVYAKKIDLQKLAAERDQLWAEAVVAYQNDEHWWLTEDEEERLAEAQAEYLTEHPWESIVRKYVDGGHIIPGPDGRPVPAPKLDFVTTTELLTQAIGKDAARQSRSDQMALAEAMRKLKWKKAEPMNNGVRLRGWERPGT